ncbi:MAG: rod shape-determining protein [Candidatus Raymondbacteria bacterium RifOxyA12_full_50_37]|uniref:Cell shape-determining protein MreB n=1 Tax=Candidatus Raymondbacteria bacterium RIFOXYD12_FULL_49_13 TaxID=1817890 RepID=A0A1F7F4J2_UNCRA|nr:MAG: rod shape-determining protein [Candidatus Raymondbacteria bacterium RifOxyA12_full_50_37]OGJ86244.1 MAG: rod shape-determining protein [Candidatus Raymondbacteria bacterium RIFOXYA2_FULL_49_16]OGJ95782.1 MAG: rod shape-determining protein [Candidatus Raymondbacteria bacterium RIFOXYC2_FULL_50_21]OGK01457.1 MAG: rod shape-determining protein [Candidatus Raymondbacteria bacterium RIFOXYD12_FULL_49_13]OGK04731.1 MAG: rod shape-determining protein [Candidatus Raymondbacteria bacterium RifOx
MGLFNLFSNDMGIDLGTANTLIHISGKGMVINEPSVVAVNKHTGKVVAIGMEAKRMLGRTPEDIHAVRPMKDGVITDFHLVEALLKHFIRRCQKYSFFVRPRVVCGVPSGITEVEKRAVMDSLTSAGAREVYLVAEPMAAAIGMGIPVEDPSGNMVIDIGGGTAEIAVIALYGIVCDASVRVGGDEMDEAIILYLKKTYNLLVGESTAEQIKMQIGSAFPLEEELEMEVKGRDLVAGIPKTLKLSSAEIREALTEPVNNIVLAVKQALEQTPPELSADILDKGIVMTGGGSQLRGLDERLRQETNLPVNLIDDPLSRVALGTAKILENIDKYRKVLLNSGR